MALKGKKSKNIFYSFKYAFEGIFYGIKNARNLQIDIVIAILVTICGFLFNISILEWTLVLICFALVMSLELVNTAIEEVVNLASPNIHPLAKVSKDVAAGAVLLSAIFSSIIGIIIFLPKLIDMF